MQFCVKYGIIHVENAILGYLIDIVDLSHPCYVYPIPIFLAIKISSAKKVKPGISQVKERYLCDLKKTKVIHGISCIVRLGSFQLHSGSLGSSSLWGLVAPSHPGAMAATLSPVLHHSYSESSLLGLSHRQTPQTRLAPPKLPLPLVQLVDVATFLPDSLEASAQQCGNFLPFR